MKFLKCTILFVLLIYFFKWCLNYNEASSNKEKIKEVKIGMNKHEVLHIMGEPFTKYKNKYKYSINANPLYQMIGVIVIQNEIVDTIYSLED